LSDGESFGETQFGDRVTSYVGMLPSAAVVNAGSEATAPKTRSAAIVRRTCWTIQWRLDTGGPSSRSIPF
jgi:hypothetical protein